MPYKDPAKRAEIKRHWHERHPTWREEWKRANPDYWFKQYGITRADYDRLCDEQEGKCAMCGDGAKLVVDHCHVTNRLRALLCGHCNSALGFLKDDPERARAAAHYLVAHRLPLPK